ncbi:MAG TPA: hypothetical protein VJC39_00850 [Candidatus Nanoarchaeia archaeon]|nr:hypothetical protein [Candidatus Nanoarchaeia archaeon]
MNWRDYVLGMGLAAVVSGGCQEYVSKPVRAPAKIELLLPKGCARLKDIRLVYSYSNRSYQVLCIDPEGDPVLYAREYGEEGWTEVRTDH